MRWPRTQLSTLYVCLRPEIISHGVHTYVIVFYFILSRSQNFYISDHFTINGESHSWKEVAIAVDVVAKRKLAGEVFPQVSIQTSHAYLIS